MEEVKRSVGRPPKANLLSETQEITAMTTENPAKSRGLREAAIRAEQAKPTAKGAALLAKYEAETDELALAVYQFIAEGRAERNWDMMASCIEDSFVSSRYAKIARDEGFHASIGARKLESLCTDAGTQARATQLAQQMRKDLYDISCANSKSTVASQQVVAEAYGW